MTKTTKLGVWTSVLFALAHSLGGAGSAQAQSTLWGWADLHAHPATHLALGANADGNDGIFWGKPGMSLATSSLASDLPVCSPDKHGGFDADAVRHLTHVNIISTIDNITGFTHGPNGSPSFSQWPHARSLTHQQMHVTALRRAYEGGQRLMIASATDNELLSSLWRSIGYNAAGNPVPGPSAGFDLASAKRQLTFIRQLANANNTWLEVAYSAADARRIISSDKLAIILSVELDALTPAQVLQLVREDGVRHVIPVHLVDNAIGGTAVYNDAFNTSNAFMNSSRQTGNWNRINPDGFLDVEYDTKLSFRLGRPQTLIPDTGNLISGGAIYPTPVDDATLATLGYNASLDRGGHRNIRGLKAAALPFFRQLASLGVLIDIAHMSEKSATATINNFAKVDGYPLMDSHTGMRAPGEIASDERALRRDHAQAIADLGGVIGVGTEGILGTQVLVSEPALAGGGLLRFTGSYFQEQWGITRSAGNPVVSNLTVTIHTGGDDLRGGNNRAWARVDIAGSVLEVDLSGGANWANNSVHTKTFRLPAGTRMNQLRSFGLRADPNARNSIFDSPDNWNVDRVEVTAALAGSDTIGTWSQNYLDVLSIMHTRGTALGTDINGLAPQISFSGDPVVYPVNAAARYGRSSSPSLGRSVLGTKTFDFRTDGIAHYGMLADFMQAVGQKSTGPTVLNALFQSANDVVEMWERAESRAGLVGDFNGDGRSDVAVWRPTARNWAVHLATGTGLRHLTWTGSWGSDGPIRVGDFNGDGRSDIIMWRPSGGDWTLNLSTGTGFTSRVWSGGSGSDGPIFIGDFNGDGKSDVLIWRPATNNWRVNISTGAGFSSQIWSGGPGSDGPIYIGDFNGDGKSDVIMSKNADHSWTVNLSTGTGFNRMTWTGAWGSDGPINVGDFNGDGKTDLAMWRPSVGDWTVNISTGTNFSWSAWAGAPGRGPIHVGDFNGDGKKDLAIWRATTRDWVFNISTGSGFLAPRTCVGAWATDGPVHVGDFTGDRKSDVMMFRQSLNDWTVNITRDAGCDFRVW